ncbi:MAG: PAS domain S-box protein [Deltaproteobacteria bacterium]|nr:PAS domain S-box protein [Deltaproteobacteria bacterium]TLN03871.1 MAG: PAS domain S-box protein [bacterium]
MKSHRVEKKNFRDEEEKLLRPIRNSPLSIFFQNDELRYTRICNPLPGMEGADVLDKTDEDLFSPENAARLTGLKKRALRGETLIKEELSLAHDGEDFFFELSAEPVRNKMGSITGIAGVLVDVSDRKRVETSLSRSEELLQRVFDAIPDLLSVQNRDLQILYSNWHGGYGYVSPEHRKGHSFCYDAYYPGTGKPCEPCHVLEAFRTGKTVFLEKINPRVGHVEAHAYPVFDDSGEVVLVIEHIRDISERKSSEERLAKINEVFLGFGADADENINRLVALCGEQLHAGCALYNRLDNGWLKAVGQWHTPPDFPPQDKPEGHICHDVMQGNSESIWVLRDLPATSYAETDPNVMRYGLKTYIGKAVSFGGVNIGTLCVVYQQDYHPSENEKQLLGIIAGAISIEEKRKRAEEDIRLLNAELEKRVAERTAELEVANRELEAFNYSVSHDLHSPLMILEGFSRELINRYADQLDENGRYYLERIQSAGRRMEGLIDAILRLSTLSRSTIQREKVSLSSTVLLLATDLRQREPERPVEITIQPDLFVYGDKKLLKIAVENLLSNAWKYTSKTPAAVIEFGCQNKNGEQVYFVRDNGVGFSMQHADSLFIPFGRLHSKEEFPGHGIGLATVKRIVEGHGGKLWGEGEAGKGATFYFTLP